jgi:hypothetical protein
MLRFYISKSLSNNADEKLSLDYDEENALTFNVE